MPVGALRSVGRALERSLRHVPCCGALRMRVVRGRGHPGTPAPCRGLFDPAAPASFPLASGRGLGLRVQYTAREFTRLTGWFRLAGSPLPCGRRLLLAVRLVDPCLPTAQRMPQPPPLAGDLRVRYQGVQATASPLLAVRARRSACWGVRGVVLRGSAASVVKP